MTEQPQLPENLQKYLLVTTPLTKEEGAKMRNEEIEFVRLVKRKAAEDIRNLESMPVPTETQEQIVVSPDHEDYEKAQVVPYYGVPFKEENAQEQEPKP